MTLFADYKVGLVMTRSGLNDRQLVFLKNHLKLIARTCGANITLVAPVVPLREAGVSASDQRARTEQLVLPLRLHGPGADGQPQDTRGWLTIEVLDCDDVGLLVPRLAKLDEVWCATSYGSSGSEQSMRPSHVFRRAQHLREAPRFKMLHYWVELDPALLPSQETRKGKKNRPALKGY